MKLQLSDSLSLPIETVTEKLAFLGRTGSGKTFAAMKLAELMLEAGAQIISLDPVGAWHGLRIGGPWGVYIFGGLRGDYPLEPTSGKLLADLISDRGISAVLDISQFIRAEQVRFASDFIERFFNRKKAAPSAVHLFLEECQEFAPQNPGQNEAHMLHHFERMWKLGRNFGIGGSIVSQRPQEINKKVLNQAGTLFVFNMTGPQERKAIAEWTRQAGIDEDIESVLPTLKTGQPHVWSPTFLKVSKTVHILPKVTADVSMTPKVGARTKEQPLTPIDVEKLKTEMAATVERRNAENPKELRKQIAELKRQLSSHKPEAAKVEVHEVSILFDEDREKLAAIAEGLRGTAADMLVLANIIGRIQNAPKPAAPPQRTAMPRPVLHNHRIPVGPSDEELSLPERKILTVLAQYPEGKPTTTLAPLAGYTVNGHFNNMLGSLRSKGYALPGNPVRITEEGLNALGSFDPLPTGVDLQRYWLNKLKQPEKRILEPLLRVYPNGLTSDELAAEAGYTVNGHFNNMLGSLRTKDLVKRGSPICAADVFFE